MFQEWNQVLSGEPECLTEVPRTRGSGPRDSQNGLAGAFLSGSRHEHLGGDPHHVSPFDEQPQKVVQ